MKMSYNPRLNAPSSSNDFYYRLNPFYQCGFGLPNCTCYAWGRFYEISGERPRLSTANAENWWHHSDGYKRGQTPKLGAVMCWRRGKAGVSADGAGHVGIVEAINGNKITASMSAWGGTRFYTQTFTIGKYDYSGFTFQGFIYNPAVKDEMASAPKFKAGKAYRLLANLKVRKGPGKNYAHIKRNNLTDDEKEKSQKGTYAVIKADEKVKAEKVKKKKGSKYVWIKIASGWICAKESNEVYMR